MRLIVAVVVYLVAMAASAQGYVTLPDGSTRYVPPGYELVVVKRGQGGLVRVSGADPIKVEDLPARPVADDADDCTADGELSLGSPPCE